MGVGLRAGVDILRVLETEARTGDQRHRTAMRSVADQVRDGCTLSKAMFNVKNYFPPLLIQMIHASELGGRVESTFTYMADYYDDLIATRGFFIDRIRMPLIQLTLGVVVIGLAILIQGLMAPSGTPAYDATGLGLSGLGGFYLYCAVVGGVALLVGTTAFGIWKNWFGCHRFLMPIVQRIPTLGTALSTLGLSRLSMTLSMLLNAGVEAKRSTKQAFLSTGNYYYISGMDPALAAIDRGDSFGEAFAAANVFPQEFIEMVQLGELSGTETESLDHLALQYRERAKAALALIATIAGTAVWLTVLVIIGFMVLRMGLQYVNFITNLSKPGGGF
jgi:type II secretory pathway component PulF